MVSQWWGVCRALSYQSSTLAHRSRPFDFHGEQWEEPQLFPASVGQFHVYSFLLLVKGWGYIASSLLLASAGAGIQLLFSGLRDT